MCFHTPYALFGSISASTRYHGAIARSFLKVTGPNFLKHLFALIFGVDLGRLIFVATAHARVATMLSFDG